MDPNRDPRQIKREAETTASDTWYHLPPKGMDLFPLPGDAQEALNKIDSYLVQDDEVRSVEIVYAEGRRWFAVWKRR